VEGCRALAAAYAEREDKLDILVNNAGAAWVADFEAFPEKGWDKVMDLNLKSPFFLTQALHGSLKAAASDDRPAKVINIASVDGIALNPLETYSYAASKSALIYLTRRMAARLVKDRIVVTAIAPGPFASEMNVAARDRSDAVARRVPLGRIGGGRGHGRGGHLPGRAGGGLRGRAHRGGGRGWVAGADAGVWSGGRRGGLTVAEAADSASGAECEQMATLAVSAQQATVGSGFSKPPLTSQVAAKWRLWPDRRCSVALRPAGR
jgi:NAD(P)-dependent dehydrogenase (short-subunit alcohol dehydrogenase family)